MAGMVSEGMLFDIGYSDGITCLRCRNPECPMEPERGEESGVDIETDFAFMKRIQV
jgi:hypothetical protein